MGHPRKGDCLDVPDHRRIGLQLKICATDDACGSGLPLRLPAGAMVRAQIERFIVELECSHYAACGADESLVGALVGRCGLC